MAHSEGKADRRLVQTGMWKRQLIFLGGIVTEEISNNTEKFLKFSKSLNKKDKNNTKIRDMIQRKEKRFWFFISFILVW